MDAMYLVTRGYIRTAGPGVGYITPQDVRDAGITEDMASDQQVLESIAMYSDFIDQACKQWFEPRELDVKVDGSGSRILWLWIPIITIDELYMNGDWNNIVPTDQYEVYNNLGAGLFDDRKNPRITIVDLGTRSIFTPSRQSGVFEEGFKNQRVVGQFGYVEADSETPELIKRAVLKLVVKQLSSGDPTNPSPGPAGPVVSETTDGHTIRYASMVGGRKIGTIGITGDAEVEAIIQMYRAPRAIAVCA